MWKTVPKHLFFIKSPDEIEPQHCFATGHNLWYAPQYLGSQPFQINVLKKTQLVFFFFTTYIIRPKTALKGFRPCTHVQLCSITKKKPKPDCNQTLWCKNWSQLNCQLATNSDFCLLKKRTMYYTWRKFHVFLLLSWLFPLLCS